MNISSISSSSLASLLETNSTATSSSSSKVDLSSILQDSSDQLSDIGKLMSKLQDLQKSDPDKFKQITAEISTKLKDAATAASDSGDTEGAKRLNALADKFSQSSQTGNMPELGAHHGAHRAGGHHGGSHKPSSTDQSSDDSTDATSSTASASSTAASQYNSIMAMFQQSSSTDPMSTLAGIMSDVFSTQQS